MSLARLFFALIITGTCVGLLACALLVSKTTSISADGRYAGAQAVETEAGSTSEPHHGETFPRNLAGVTSVRDRKQIFLTALQPLVVAENRRIESQRSWLRQARSRLISGRIHPNDLSTLTDLCRYYRLPAAWQPTPDRPVEPALIDKLLQRVDTLPPSLVLAQSAIESGWGTSRFATEGNNLFGQWVTGNTPGLVPIEATAGSKYRLATYDSVADSVRSYLRNINTHRAYRELRQLRAYLRAEGTPVTGPVLAPGLLRYSQRRDAYIEDVLRIIHGNDLVRLDTPVLELAKSNGGWPTQAFQ